MAKKAKPAPAEEAAPAPQPELTREEQLANLNKMYDALPKTFTVTLENGEARVFTLKTHAMRQRSVALRATLDFQRENASENPTYVELANFVLSDEQRTVEVMKNCWAGNHEGIAWYDQDGDAVAMAVTSFFMARAIERAQSTLK